MTTYQVVILGLKPGQNRDEALQRLAATFKQPVERLSSLVNGTRAVVKRGADIALAAKLQAAIEAAGFESVVEPEVSSAPPNAAAAELAGQHASAAHASNAHSGLSSNRVANVSPTDGAPPSAERTAANAPIRWWHLAIVGLGVVALVVAFTKPFSRSSSSSSTREAATTSSRSQDDARFSPSERLMLALANTRWSCTLNESKQVEILFIVDVVRDGTEPGGSGLIGLVSIESPTKATPSSSFMWSWKSKLDSTVLGKDLNLSDDEIAIVSAGANPERWSVLRATLSQDGSYLSWVERGTANAFNCDIVLLANSKKHKYETDKEIRSMLLKTKSGGLPRSSTAPTVQPTSVASSSSPPTAAEAYQAMELHQNSCQVRGNIACIAICEKSKDALLKLAVQLSLNPQLPTPPQFQGVVNQYRSLCLSQAQ